MAKYHIRYSCVSNIGRCRKINQDNFICNGQHRYNEGPEPEYPIYGELLNSDHALLGIFDGMGGEMCGEEASLIAAEQAAEMKPSGKTTDDLLRFCRQANSRICQFAEQNQIYSMGTTAAMIVFAKKEIAICNIGDSKIFRLYDESDHTRMEQISVDHVAIGMYGRKPPLSQNLGIPEQEMMIEPYVALGQYHDMDLYLICSDGLTDMVSNERIEEIVMNSDFENCTTLLVEEALKNGGKDNVTVLLCEVQKERSFFRFW